MVVIRFWGFTVFVPFISTLVMYVHSIHNTFSRIHSHNSLHIIHSIHDTFTWFQGHSVPLPQPRERRINPRLPPIFLNPSSKLAQDIEILTQHVCPFYYSMTYIPPHTPDKKLDHMLWTPEQGGSRVGGGFDGSIHFIQIQTNQTFRSFNV